jgi:glycosyltransferase involved in cell wall biosynthesis
MINILYLHETAHMGGAENSLLQLVLNIDRKRFVPVFILGEDGALAKLLAQGGVPVRVITLPRLFNCLGFLRSLFRIIAIVRRGQIDIIHTNSVRTHLYGTLAARMLGIHIVWHERCMISDEWVDFDRIFYFLAHRIICNSQAIARRFLRSGKLADNVRVVLNGVDVQKFSLHSEEALLKAELGIKNDETVIGIASRFDINKGHETLLTAIKKIISGHLADQCKFKLLIAGTGVFEQESGREQFLRQMVEDLGLNEEVIFTGFRQDMEKIYAAMDIVVLASYNEGCPRVVIEAMALAKPVVGTNSGGTTEIIVDGLTGLLFTPGNSEELAGKLVYLLNNPQVARQMGISGRKTVEENFSIERNIRQIQDIYLGVLGNEG